MAVLREFTWSAIAPATSRIRRNPPRLVAAEQLGRRSPTGLLLEIIKNDNTNGDSCWVFFGGDKASKEESVILDSGGSYVRYWPFVSSEAMQATCASTSDTLYVEIK